jgi:hypothetical protein
MDIKKLLVRAALGLLLGAATVGLISVCATKLPHSQARDEITDAASVPALLLARLFFPEGVHTGAGAAGWGTAFLCSNILFYAALWFAILCWLGRTKSPRKGT